MRYDDDVSERSKVYRELVYMLIKVDGIILDVCSEEVMRKQFSPSRRFKRVKYVKKRKKTSVCT